MDLIVYAILYSYTIKSISGSLSDSLSDWLLDSLSDKLKSKLSLIIFFIAFFFISYLEQLFDSNTAASKLDIDIKDQTRLLRDFSDICCDSENEGALQNEAISKCANVPQLLPQQSKSIQKRGTGT